MEKFTKEQAKVVIDNYRDTEFPEGMLKIHDAIVILKEERQDYYNRVNSCNKIILNTLNDNHLTLTNYFELDLKRFHEFLGRLIQTGRAVNVESYNFKFKERED